MAAVFFGAAFSAGAAFLAGAFSAFFGAGASALAVTAGAVLFLASNFSPLPRMASIQSSVSAWRWPFIFW